MNCCFDNNQKVIYFVTTFITDIFKNIFVMTDQEKKDKLEELENLKLLLKFHSENRIINLDKKFIEHIDEILDEINRIEKELNDRKQH